MTATGTIPPQQALARLDWESNHFGLEAAQLVGAHADDAALAMHLCAARQAGVQLVVWPAADEREASSELLHQFGGTLVDRKATFNRALEPLLAVDHAPPHSDLPVVPYTAATVSPALLELALASGVYSRFNVDAHFAREKFADMYRLWIERSVSGQMADVVLVIPLDQIAAAKESLDNGATCASVASPLGGPLGGMVTISVRDGVGSIGLIAVAAELRGRGAGGELMQAAHDWMRDHGASRARVVTQLANLPARRLYERSGYSLSSVQPYYHFWL